MDLDDELPPELVEVEQDPVIQSPPLRTRRKSPIPITLLTGYLGSGKTTLLRYILEENHGYRVAVCMNDFSDTTDIESTSFTFSDPSSSATPPNSTSPSKTSKSSERTQETRFLSLPNGCLCCSIKQPGIAAIENMIEEMEAADDGEEYVVEEDGEEGGLDIVTQDCLSPPVSGSGSFTDLTHSPRPPIPRLQRPRLRPRQRPIDWLLIELTGIADPTSIAKTFWQNEEMGGDGGYDDAGDAGVGVSDGGDGELDGGGGNAGSRGGRFRLDGIVGVVDCRNVREQLRERSLSGEANECQRQIAASDVILLNKTDLVSPREIEEAREEIQRINPTATIKQTHRARVPLNEIFHLGSYSATGTEAGDRAPRFLRDSGVSSGLRALNLASADQHEHEHGHGKGSATSHATTISSVVIEIPVLSMSAFDRVESFLQSVHWDSTPPGDSAQRDSVTDEGFQILRSKGVLYRDDGKASILQGVRDLFELTTLPIRPTGAIEKGKLVFIGRNLPALQVWKDALRM